MVPESLRLEVGSDFWWTCFFWLTLYIYRWAIYIYRLAKDPPLSLPVRGLGLVRLGGVRQDALGATGRLRQVRTGELHLLHPVRLVNAAKCTGNCDRLQQISSPSRTDPNFPRTVTSCGIGFANTTRTIYADQELYTLMPLHWPLLHTVDSCQRGLIGEYNIYGGIISLY